MGYGRWDATDWATHSTKTKSQRQDQIFTQRGMHPDLDPAKIKVRESVDSDKNPNTTPIIISCDETGSMGMLAELIIKEGLGRIVEPIYTHKPVTDPQIMCMGVGDAFSDNAPIQATQFESEVGPLVEQIKKIYIEHNGGSNLGESYALTWLFATYKTLCDAIVKRKRKGYIFTIGDEAPHLTITKDQIIRFFGMGCEGDVDVKALLKATLPFWNVYHLVVQPVPYQDVAGSWQALLGPKNVVFVEDHTKLPEVIVAIIRLVEGQTNVTSGLDKSTALVVRNATRNLTQV